MTKGELIQGIKNDHFVMNDHYYHVHSVFWE